MKRELSKNFEDIYGKGGEVRLFYAPGRVNLIGEHTDYNGGHVFPCGLNMGTYLAVRKREDDLLCFYSKNKEELGIITSSLKDLSYSEGADWTNYPKGVIWTLKERGYALPCGLEVFVYGNIPNGSGLSSSASLEVVTGLALRELYGFHELSMVDLALIGQYSENHYNGCNCGIMDQFAVAMAKKDFALFLNTNNLSYQQVPVNLPGFQIVITNSKVKHALVDSAYNERRAQCEEALKDLQSVAAIDSLGDLDEDSFERYQEAIKNPVCAKRARHAVYENQRAVKAVQALTEGNLVAFGKLMNESHRSLRDDYQVSCPEVDFLAEQAWENPAVLGSRITGGGFGGCTVSIVKEEGVKEFVGEIGRKYQEKLGLQAEFYIAKTDGGARELTE